MRVNLLFDGTMISDPQVKQFAGIAANRAALCERCRNVPYELRYFHSYARLRGKIGHRQALVFLGQMTKAVNKFDETVIPIDYRRFPKLKERYMKYVKTA